MSEMVKAVSDAISQAMQPISSFLSETQIEQIARCAIAAMREPTKAMTEWPSSDIEFNSYPDVHWRAMIDEALK